MAAIDAVIFDLDDTLYPEREFAFSGFVAVAKAFVDRLGDPVESAAAMRRLFETEHRRRLFEALLESRGLARDPVLIARMVEAYRSHIPTVRLHADADAALTRLRPRYRLGLISDGRPIAQWNKIDALGLRPRLDEIIVTSELRTTDPGETGAHTPTGGASAPQETPPTDYAKPHPRAFELMARRLNVKPAACAYIADNPAKDFIAPNALGWLTVRIRRADGIYRHQPAAPTGEAQRLITSLDGLEFVWA